MRLNLRILLFFSLLSLMFSSVTAQSTPNVWDVMRGQFALNHQTTQPEVQEQLRWLINHPSYLRKLGQSEPYIYHILTEIKKRKIPGEIALIPMIESAFDPFAYSGSGAAGLWQLMPRTGSDLGLKQDWWFDARRSIRPSTNAALNYLEYLHRFFHGNWLLAFAAYDSGEGTIARAIKNSGQNNRQVNFWSLPVPRETKAYIPRLLALAEVIQNPQRYHVQLPDIPHAPYFEEVNIGSQIDLNHAAKLAGISYHDLIKLNPGFNRWATAPDQPFKLLVPADKAEDFMRKLADIPLANRMGWERHLQKGQYVLIPTNKNAPDPIKATHLAAAKLHEKSRFKPLDKYKLIHIVQKNDSYHAIEQKYHVSKNAIIEWNHLSPGAPLHKGQTLIIWKTNHTNHVYTVHKGDTLSHIAKANGIRIQTLIALNPGLSRNRLRIGQKIVLG